MKSDVTKMRLRATPEARAMVFEAAKRRGISVSKFVVQAAVERAICILDGQEERETLTEMNAKLFTALDDEDRKRRLEVQFEAAEESENTAHPDTDITSPPHAA
jgi:uncharacterized protein (DUF1778 family)